ncbi:MAG: hypothetical protein QOG10_7148 [Kribbellaceae bacterium]|jgi:hypothetical protein|nr:hypothetical protein [Kribbellaceae bacterium]
MSTVGLRHQVQASYHQVFLTPHGHSPILDPRQPGRLLAIDPAGPAVIVLTGCAQGPVHLTIHSTDQPPTALAESMAGWDIGEEDDIYIAGELYALSPLADLPDGAVFTPAAPGLHRIRVLARGRAAQYDFVVDQPTEEYGVTIWPTTTPAERTHVGDDGLTF